MGQSGIISPTLSVCVHTTHRVFLSNCGNFYFYDLTDHYSSECSVLIVVSCRCLSLTLMKEAVSITCKRDKIPFQPLDTFFPPIKPTNFKLPFKNKLWAIRTRTLDFEHISGILITSKASSFLLKLTCPVKMVSTSG